MTNQTMNAQRGLPEITLLLDGEPLEDKVSRGLECIDVLQEANLPSHCELQFIFDDVIDLPFAPGKTLEINIAGFTQILFLGEIVAKRTSFLPDGNRSVVVRAYDALHRLRKAQPVRQFESLTLKSLLASVLEEYGLSINYCAEDVEIDRLFQWCQSDWRFIVEQLNQYGLQCYLNGTELSVFNLLQGEGECLLVFGENLLSVVAEESAEPGCREVAIQSWNPSTVETFYSKQAQVDADFELAEHLAPDIFNTSGKLIITGAISTTQENALMLATATLHQRLASEVIVQGTVEGNPEMFPGKKSVISGIDFNLCRAYTTTQTRHLINRRQGYTTEFNSTPPPALQPRLIHSALAFVTDIDDPDNAGRVTVSYPCLGELTSGWQSVVTAGAGEKKGLLALPDVGDQVLVMFAGGDVTQGIVMGGLFGQQNLPDQKLKSGKNKVFNFTTLNGQKLILDDQRGAVTLKNRDGSFIDLAPSKVLLHANADIVIEAPGKSLVFKASTVDFEQSK
jgi:phage baseplate assembly protein gpV/phage protein D